MLIYDRNQHNIVKQLSSSIFFKPIKLKSKHDSVYCVIGTMLSALGMISYQSSLNSYEINILIIPLHRRESEGQSSTYILNNY